MVATNVNEIEVKFIPYHSHDNKHELSKTFKVDDEELSAIDLDSIEEITVDPIARELKKKGGKVLVADNEAFDIDMIYVNVEKGDYGAFMFYKMELIYQPIQDLMVSLGSSR